MRLIPSDPDIATIVARIKNGDIDLQPNFQRGEVWSSAKKQKLIDSILRDWHVPPIHVIEIESSKQEILDGQQRLVAIRDFVNGVFKINGYIEPSDPEINALHGSTYEQLPISWKRRFDQFTVRLFRITDYKPEEPGELFFRLNQPVGLTTAEQRNAFFGEARQQVRNLVQEMEALRINKEFIGFENVRMAYDDVIARVLTVLENGTLADKIDANKLANRYRAGDGFPDEHITRVSTAIQQLAKAKDFLEDTKIRLNKATLFSWLIFLIRAHRLFLGTTGSQELGELLWRFEHWRKGHDVSFDLDRPNFPILPYLRLVYNDRSTSRVGDVSSILLRDIVIWAFFVSSTNIASNSEDIPDVAPLVNGIFSLVLSAPPSIDFDPTLNLLVKAVSWEKI